VHRVRVHGRDVVRDPAHGGRSGGVQRSRRAGHVSAPIPMTDKAAVSIRRVHAEPASEHTAFRGVAAPLPLIRHARAAGARPSTTSPCFDRSSPEPELPRSAAAIEWEAAPGSLVLLLTQGPRQERPTTARAWELAHRGTTATRSG
jgi:hypothetical protein